MPEINAKDPENMSLAQTDRTFKQPLNWTTTSFMILFHVGALAALFFFSW